MQNCKANGPREVLPASYTSDTSDYPWLSYLFRSHEFHCFISFILSMKTKWYYSSEVKIGVMLRKEACRQLMSIIVIFNFLMKVLDILSKLLHCF